MSWALSIAMAVLCAIELAHASEVVQPSSSAPFGSAAGIDTPVASSASGLEGHKPYRAGPLAARESSAWPALPDGTEEVVALSLLVAFVFGLRAAGLSRHSEQPSRR